MPLLEVKIEKDSRAVSANKPQQVTCRAVGSSPPPHISWWKAGARLQASHETVKTLTSVVCMNLLNFQLIIDPEIISKRTCHSLHSSH